MPGQHKLVERECLKCNKCFLGLKRSIFCSLSCSASYYGALRSAEKGYSGSSPAKKRWNALHRDALRAHDSVRYALSRGKLIPRPCEICGESYSTVGHHQDYSKPLDVNWLCHSCHKLVHKAVRDVYRLASTQYLERA